ncbi:LGFP repeat-containing protein [Nocardia sp. 004]|uniref:LGFP repeat-containing protein n=1 Tax=Nocardia sp. 004 TaxID=3385978 RepID=UPI0039A31468
MHHFARRTAGITVALATTGLIVLGCGDDEDGSTAAEGMTTTTAAPRTLETTYRTGSRKTATTVEAAEETRIATVAGEIAVSGEIYHEYLRNGGPDGPLGLPLAAEESGPDASEYQDFTGGTIYLARDSEPRIVWGEIRKAWQENGGAQGQFGHPVSDEKTIPGGKQSDFTGGIITVVDGVITVTPKP